ncbi:MAG: Fic family protein, partial [Coriobacteriia bacterium]|nr:Fic family protein [Coriobacteriia bacterium]
HDSAQKGRICPASRRNGVRLAPECCPACGGTVSGIAWNRCPASTGIRTFRLRETSIGVAPSQIAVQLHNLLADARARIETTTIPADSADEMAVWFHHRLVQVHLFPNGNGRHARLAADLLAIALGGRRFTWGSGDLTAPGETRSACLRALQKADREFDYALLRAFARS